MYLPARLTPNRITAMFHPACYDFLKLNLLGNSRREIEGYGLAAAIGTIIQLVAVEDVDSFFGKQGSLMPGMTRLPAFLALFAFSPFFSFGNIIGGRGLAGIGGVL